MTQKFIPLGLHCNISFLSQDIHMKYETGLFEWLQSNNLQSITNIVDHIKNTIDANIIQGYDGHVHILNNDVFSFHYNLEEYKTIFERRANRFIDKIKTSSELIFVRINPRDNSTTEEEINNFCQVIHLINPTPNIKFLLINTVDNPDTYKQLDNSKIVNATLIQREFMSEDCPDPYLKDNIKIQKQFLFYLQECGVNTDLRSNMQFTDKP